MYSLLQFFGEFSQLIGDGDGEDGNKNSVDKKRDDAASDFEIRFDVIVYEFLDDVIPSQSCHQAKSGGSQGHHLFDYCQVKLFIV